MGKKKNVLKEGDKGVTLGLGICSFFASIFEMNEMVAKKRKLTDEQIEEVVRKEYPNRKGYFFSGSRPKKKRISYASSGTSSSNWGKVTVNSYRSKYNKGVFTGKIPPDVPSFRYDYRGEKVDSRTGKRPLTPTQIETILALHQELRKSMT